MASGFEQWPNATRVGDSWLLAWESHVSDVVADPSIDLVFIESDGTVGVPQVGVHGGGFGEAPQAAFDAGGPSLSADILPALRSVAET